MIPFNRPHLTGREFTYIQEAAAAGQLAGNGRFTGRCHRWLERELSAPRALLTHSATAALEMAALLLDVGPGDEVIMPSFTFVSTANAFVLRGATPVFVDVRPDTLNIDETLIEAAIGPRTRAIVVVHYAGVGCDMDAVLAIARRHNLFVVEDAAQGLLSRYQGRPLGSMGHLAAISFHETKNVMSGEGGALIVNHTPFEERAEILWEKGTDRSRFARGEVDKYRWVDLGSSFLPGELVAAFLYAQLEHANEITDSRLALWDQYYKAAALLEPLGIRRPIVPDVCEHNAHLFYLLLPERMNRRETLRMLNEQGVNAVSHYVPLHSAPAGARFGRVSGSMTVTDTCAEQLVRLPLWVGMTPGDPSRAIETLAAVATVAQ
jgi:dTDP-4-amino-4,6-dideoxygalactose transaminase